MINTIQFYSEKANYGESSNFALYPIKLNGKVWKTTEHYYQSQKFKGTAHADKIRKAPSPMKAKFSQHKQLSDLLVSTGDAKLVEHTESDSYWGDGGDGKGRNMLGKLLMKIRNELKPIQLQNK